MAQSQCSVDPMTETWSDRPLFSNSHGTIHKRTHRVTEQVVLPPECSECQVQSCGRRFFEGRVGRFVVDNGGGGAWTVRG